MSEPTLERRKDLCDYCGFLDWTVRQYGRVTHKEDCPHRTDPWSQTYPHRTAEQEAKAPKRAQDEDPKTYMVPPHLEQEAEARRLERREYWAHMAQWSKPEDLGEQIDRVLAKAEQERDECTSDLTEHLRNALERAEAAEREIANLREAEKNYQEAMRRYEDQGKVTEAREQRMLTEARRIRDEQPDPLGYAVADEVVAALQATQKDT